MTKACREYTSFGIRQITVQGKTGPFGEDTGRSWMSAMEAGKTDGWFYKLDIQNETGLPVMAGLC
jgi:hypothetical protein